MKTILLVDDDPQLRQLVRMTLADPAYRILEASNGTEAVALARQVLPDLLVLDWRMPGMSGIDVARALHQEPATAHMPILMLTAVDQATDQDQGRVVGISVYLVKPFSPLELLAKAQELLGDPHHPARCQTSLARQATIPGRSRDHDTARDAGTPP